MKMMKAIIIYMFIVCFVLYKVCINISKHYYHPEKNIYFAAYSVGRYSGPANFHFPDYLNNSHLDMCFKYLKLIGKSNGYAMRKYGTTPIFRAISLSRCVLRNCEMNIMCSTKDNIISYHKPKYINKTRSPCFYASYNEKDGFSESKTSIYKKYPDAGIGLVCLPAVYILGFAKCGSTDLHYRLLQHPHIHGGEMKELRFWYGSIPWLGWRKFYGQSNKTLYDLFSYIKMFDNATSYIGSQIHRNEVKDNREVPDLLLDSDITMYRPEAIDGITHLVPDAKAIVIMRDPVERELSFYRFLHAANHQNNPRYHYGNTPKGFHKYVQHELQQEVPFAERQIPFQKEKYQSACYVNYVEYIVRKFKPNHVLFLRFESYIKNPQLIIRSQILPFLNLEAFSLSMETTNRINNSRKQYLMLNGTKTLLQDYFRSCNLKLSNILENKKWRWNY